MSNDLKYIDIHGHLNFPDYDADRGEAIERARRAGVGMITVGTDLQSSKKAVELAEAHDDIWATVGIHPTDVNDITDADFSELRGLAIHPKVVAIGECGLDYFHSKPEDMEKQREMFIRHIQLANEVGKPLMLHIRNRKNDGLTIGKNDGTYDVKINAYQEAVSILKQYARVRANFHFFAGTVQDARDIVSMGNTVSFTGVITFARDYDEVIRSVPLESIMSETDCPFVAPVPYRGKRNEPSYVVEVVRKIAEIRGEDEDTVRGQMADNVQRFLG